MNRNGFTLIEIIAALLILSVGILAMTASAARLSTSSVTAEEQATALEAVNERLERALLHPGYVDLDSVFAGSESGVPAQGYTRVTTVDRVQESSEDGEVTDYTRITVSVSGPGLEAPLIRHAVLGAP
jgi:prepilin-type N-terminal cleavage/methylation domain-containing protein